MNGAGEVWKTARIENLLLDFIRGIKEAELGDVGFFNAYTANYHWNSIIHETAITRNKKFARYFMQITLFLKCNFC